MKIIQFLVFIFLLYIPNISLSEGIIIHNDLPQAQAISLESDRELLVLFSAEYCKFCQDLKTEIISSELTDNLVVCIIDTQNDQGLSRKMKVRNLPTSVHLKNKTEISRIVGYNKDKYILWLNGLK